MTEPEAVGVLLVEDHSLLSLGLQAQLSAAGIGAAIATLGPVEDLLADVVAALPVLVVVDLGLPYEGGGAALVGPMVAVGASVMVLTGETDVELWATCLEAGALGVVQKSETLPVILAAIERACRGRPVNAHRRSQIVAEARRRRNESEQLLADFATLTPRECDVLSGLIDGLNARQLAERDFVSVDTIRSQIKAVLSKLGVASQLEAVARARVAGWATRSPDAAVDA